jgi:RHS repeat-associated protein
MFRSGGSAYDWLYLHQGGRYDVTSGLYHFRFRDYSPTLGRWTSLDPLRYAAGDVNLYRPLGNNPLNSLDPSGLDRIDQIEIQGQAITVWYVDERLFRDDPRHYVGRLVIVNGEQFVCRRVGNQEYYVPLAKVEELTSYWSWEPTERSEWDNWFIQYGVTNPNAQRLPTPTAPNFYLFGQPSYWPWSKGASLSLWENIKHIGRMVPVAGAGVVGGGLSGAGIGALCGGGGGAIPGALGGAASGLIAAAFAKDPAEAFAYGFAGGILGGGATAAATRFAASRAAGQAAVGAVTQAGRAREAVADPNKLHHIFGNPQHKLGPLLNQFGGNQQAAFEAVQNAAQAAIQQQGITGKYKIVVNVAGLDVTVKGTVMNGVARIGTFYIPLR